MTEKILIVDDYPSQQELLTSLLRLGGYHDIVIARSPDIAFEVLGIGESEQDTIYPDLILLDILLPYMDGIEVCRRIKSYKKLRDIPIIMVTVSDDSEDVENAFEAGVTDYIRTPLVKIELLARVRHALKIKKEFESYRNREQEITSTMQSLLSFSHGLTESLHLLDRKQIQSNTIQIKSIIEKFINRLRG